MGAVLHIEMFLGGNPSVLETGMFKDPTADRTDNVPSGFSTKSFPVSFISYLSVKCTASIRLTNEAPSVLIFSPMFAHVQVTRDKLHIAVPPK